MHLPSILTPQIALKARLFFKENSRSVVCLPFMMAYKALRTEFISAKIDTWCREKATANEAGVAHMVYIRRRFRYTSEPDACLQLPRNLILVANHFPSSACSSAHLGPTPRWAPNPHLPGPSSNIFVMAHIQIAFAVKRICCRWRACWTRQASINSTC